MRRTADYDKLSPAFVERLEKVRELTPEVVDVPEMKQVVKALNDLYVCEKKGTQDLVTHLAKVADYITALHKSVNDATITEQSGTTENIKNLQETISTEFGRLLKVVIQLPTRLPEPKDPIDPREEIKAVESAVKALELNPQINVPKPEVITDHKDVVKELKAVEKAINKIEIPEVNIPEADYSEITSRLDQHTPLLEELVKQSQIRAVSGGGGGGSTGGGESTAAEPISLTKFDPSDAVPTYIGTNTDAAAADGDTDWVIYKYTYNVGGETTMIQRAVGSWSGRASLF